MVKVVKVVKAASQANRQKSQVVKMLQQVVKIKNKWLKVVKRWLKARVCSAWFAAQSPCPQASHEQLLSSPRVYDPHRARDDRAHCPPQARVSSPRVCQLVTIACVLGKKKSRPSGSPPVVCVPSALCVGCAPAVRVCTRDQSRRVCACVLPTQQHAEKEG